MIGQLGAMSACFGDGAPTGSFRAMVSVNDEGKLSARVGGLGDHASEACVAQALAASSVAAPDTYPVEAACDLQRGDAQPWRVDATSGYDVYELTSKEIVHGTEHTSLPFGKGVSLPARDPSQIALVIAAPDTTADAMSSGLGAIKGARPALVAIRQESGAVVLVGAVPEYSFGGSSSPSVTLAIKDGRYKACVAHVASQPALGDAALADRAGLATLLRNAFAGCAGSQPCDPSLVFSITTPIGASDWLALAGAAHDAGFSTIATGGVTCSP